MPFRGRARRRAGRRPDEIRPPQSDPGTTDETIAIGVLGRPHGVHGEIALRVFNPAGAAAVDGLRRVILARDGRREERNALARSVAGGLLLSLEGVDSREAAAVLTLAEVRVRRADLPPLAPGDFYVVDLPGCEVLDEDGRAIGTVTGTFWNGAHDVMEVRGDGGEELIPVVPAYVVAFDGVARRVTVRWSVDADVSRPRLPTDT